MTEMLGQLSIPVVDPLADALAWKERNPAAYQQMVDWAYADLRGGQRPSTKLYIEILRRPHAARRLGFAITPAIGPVKIPNALSSGLARLIMREHPAITLPTSGAKVDSWRRP